MTKRKIHIVPGGTFSAEIKALAKACGYDENELYDDHIKSLSSPNRIPDSAHIALASGSPRLRKELKARFNPEAHYPVLIHPSVIIMDPAGTHINEGSLICAASVLTTNIKIGKFVIVNLQCSIGHDSVIGDFCSLMPGVRISGGVSLEEGVYLGSNAVVLPQVSIGAGATIGAGAVVNRDLAPGKTYVGIPARELKA